MKNTGFTDGGWRWALGVLVGFIVAFEIIPVAGVIGGSFLDGGRFALTNFAVSMSRQYQNAFFNSAVISVASALVAIILGGVTALVLVYEDSSFINKMIEAVCAVSTNFAGIPLAFAFMVTLGVSGEFTVLLQNALHLDLNALGFSLVKPLGLILVYTNFQIPLAIILLLPTFRNIRPEWAEANASLGGGNLRYYAHILLPILLVPLAGVAALLFANSFGAYVTAYALAGGAINLVPIQIGFLINGNVTMNVNLGDALAVDMMLFLALATFFYKFSFRHSPGRQG